MLFAASCPLSMVDTIHILPITIGGVHRTHTVLWREGLMKRFVEGVDRGQNTLFPDRLEDWIGDDNPVRVVDVFVDELDLGGLGFRPGCSTGDRPSGLSSFGAAEALYLRLSEPGAVEPSPGM